MVYKSIIEGGARRIKRSLRRYAVTGGAVIITALGLASPAFAVSSSTIYDATPSTLPPNVASLGYEATSTSEAGDLINLGGTNRTLSKVTVTMSDWAIFADYSSNPTYSGNSTNWTHPITVNVYSSHLGSNGAPDTLLATKTQTATIPWRPAADPTCETPSAWRASNGTCYNGYAFNLDFDLSSLNVILPNSVIVSVAYNTQDHGANPTGVSGPYNSLNVGLPTGQTSSVGSDDNADNIFWNTSFAGFYTDDGVAGVGILRQDTHNSPNGTFAFKLTASPTPIASPTTRDQCTHDGWKTFNDPSFANQNDCIRWVNATASANIKLANPSQKLVFKATNKPNSVNNPNQNTVEYWNYNYPGGLHYTAAVACSYINPQTHESRFMFQIPAGHGDLSGLYVVSYVKEVNSGGVKDIYGQNSTADLTTATQWCKTGVGYNPTFYTITQGNVQVR